MSLNFKIYKNKRPRKPQERLPSMTNDFEESIKSLHTTRTSAVAMTTIEDGKVKEHIGANKIEELIPTILEAFHSQEQKIRSEYERKYTLIPKGSGKDVYENYPPEE